MQYSADLLSPACPGVVVIRRIATKPGTLNPIAKSAAVKLCCSLSGKSQREVARHFGYGSESSAGKQRKLLASELGGNPDLARALARIESAVAASAGRKKEGR